jgi:hypothetical protein
MTSYKTMAYAMALACSTAGLVSCDSSEDTPNTAGNSLVTINLEIQSTNSRASWEYSNSTSAQQLKFAWDENDNSIAVLQGGSVIQGTIVHGDASTKVEFTGAQDAKTYLIFPYSADPAKLTIAKEHTQNGDNTDHLSSEMYMYATAEANASSVKLKHAPALLRFLVKNTHGEVITPSKVTISGSFCLTANLDVVNDVLTLAPDDAANQTLSVNNETSLQSGEIYALYTTCFPTVTAGSNYTLTVTIGDKTYTSNVISGDSIVTKDADGNAAFLSGYFYTFGMKIGDELDVTSISVSENPFSDGWGDADSETDL